MCKKKLQRFFVVLLIGIFVFSVFAFSAPQAKAKKSSTPIMPPLSDAVIALDAGHGVNEEFDYYDTGAIGDCNGEPVYEKDVNLAVRALLKEKLENNGAEVYEVPQLPSRSDRVAYAEDNGADILISIHHNGSLDITANYTQLFITQKKVDLPLAEAILPELIDSLGLPDAGITSSGFGMTVYGDHPAVLSEAFFITNTFEACDFLSLEQQRIKNEAEGLYNGISDYFSQTVASVPDENAPARKIVVFDDQFSDEAAQDALVAGMGGQKIKKLGIINAQAAYLSPQAEKALANQKEIKRIDDDILNYAIGRPETSPAKAKVPTPPPAQTVSWGYTRIGANNTNGIKGAGVKVGIIDTGIDMNHPDLAVVGGYNAISPLRSPEDDNGHGTHVAGIVAALDNTIGVIGVAPEVALYAIKVLNRKGSGYLTDIIEGLDWAIANGMNVVNMSLGGAGNLSYHEAIQRAHTAGIVIVAAAGNTGGAVGYPAAYKETIAVSATDSVDNLAYFSSFGPEIDLTAPGVNIYSTYKGDSYASLSGTSMATPFVAGVAALVFSAPLELSDFNNNGVRDLDEVRQKIQDSAEDIDLNSDEQGAGLVDAENAVVANE